MRSHRLVPWALLCLALVACADRAPTDSTAFASAIPTEADRIWVGPEYYANRLQDWRVEGGRIESVEGRASKPMRTLHLLTRALAETPGTALMQVRTGPIEAGPAHEDTWSGFLLGVGGEGVDHRISALSHHWPSDDGGLIVAFDGTGRIVVRDNSLNQGYRGADPAIPLEAWPLLEPDWFESPEHTSTDVELTVELQPEGDAYRLTVTVRDAETEAVVGAASYGAIPPHQVSGNMALVSNRSPRREGPDPRPGYWFCDWTVSGSKVERHDARAFGPIMGALYALSRGTLKMTAQLGPIGGGDANTVSLEIRRDGQWQPENADNVLDHFVSGIPREQWFGFQQ